MIETSRIPLVRSRGALIAAAAVLGALALALAVTGRPLAALAVVLVGALTVAGLRAPALTVGLYLLAKYLPQALAYAAPHPATGVLQGENAATWGQLVGGFQLSDLVLLGMLAAAGIRAIFLVRDWLRGMKSPYTAWLVLPIVLLAAWLAFEVARNVGRYGLSAPGELRFEYLILCLPVYLAVAAPTRRTQRHLTLLLIVATVYVPLSLIPVIGSIKGFGVGPLDRYFPSMVSLGLFYGTLAFVVCAARRALETPRWLLGVTVAAAATCVLLDSHRSVWLAGAVAVVAVFVFRAVPREAYRRLGPVVLVAVVAAVGVSWVLLAVQHDSGRARLDAPAGTASQGDPLSFFGERTRGVVDPGEDHNASWRIQLWKAAIPMIRERPIAGEGMGGYWHFVIPMSKAPITVQPHSVYIQTLVKTGIVGLVLLLGVAVATFGYVWRALRRVTSASPPMEGALLSVGLVVLTSAFVYSLVYALVDAPLLWTGLAAGVAAAAVGAGRADAPAEAAPGAGAAQEPSS